MADPYVSLPADSSGKKIRLVEVDERDTDGTALTLYQEVVTLAGEHGDLVKVRFGRTLVGADEMTHRLLRSVCARLDLLGFAIDKTYRPPDDFGFGSED